MNEFDDVKGETGEDRTIWQQLKADPDSFSKIVKLIEVCLHITWVGGANEQFEGHAQDVLDNKNMSITFFVSTRSITISI